MNILDLFHEAFDTLTPDEWDRLNLVCWNDPKYTDKKLKRFENGMGTVAFTLLHRIIGMYTYGFRPEEHELQRILAANGLVSEVCSEPIHCACGRTIDTVSCLHCQKENLLEAVGL